MVIANLKRIADERDILTGVRGKLPDAFLDPGKGCPRPGVAELRSGYTYATRQTVSRIER